MYRGGGGGVAEGGVGSGSGRGDGGGGGVGGVGRRICVSFKIEKLSSSIQEGKDQAEE